MLGAPICGAAPGGGHRGGAPTRSEVAAGAAMFMVWLVCCDLVRATGAGRGGQPLASPQHGGGCCSSSGSGCCCDGSGGGRSDHGGGSGSRRGRGAGEQRGRLARLLLQHGAVAGAVAGGAEPGAAGEGACVRRGCHAWGGACVGTAGVSRVGAAAVGGLAWEPRVCGRRAVGECVCASREWSLCGGGGAVAGLGPWLWRVCCVGGEGGESRPWVVWWPGDSVDL